MSYLNDGDILTKVSKFYLERGDRTLTIEVHQVIFGDFNPPFVALPKNNGKEADDGYVGYGDSAQGALKDLLSKIKNVSLDAIFPQNEQGQEPLEGLIFADDLPAMLGSAN